MARLIPNENTWVGFATTVTTLAAPTAAEVLAAEDLTGYLVSINATAQGNTVPTPSLDTLFETSIPGTVQAQFTADFYRDDDDDTAWETLPRAEEGFFIISRFGGSGATGVTGGTENTPASGDDVEVWPVKVTSRTMQNMTSNQVMMFTATCSVPVEPVESATVAS